MSEHSHTTFELPKCQAGNQVREELQKNRLGWVRGGTYGKSKLFPCGSKFLDHMKATAVTVEWQDLVVIRALRSIKRGQKNL